LTLRKATLFLLVLMIFLISVPIINASPLSQEETLTGTIDDENPYLSVYIEVEEGDYVTVWATATSGDLDTYLILIDPNDEWVAENDDANSSTTDSVIEYQAIESGRYQVVIGRYNFEDGESSGDVELTLNISAAESEASETTEEENFSAVPPQNPSDIAEWTILAFMGGDNNLEQSAIIDTNEFEIAGGSDATVRVVLFLDRSPEYDFSNGDWSTARVYEMGQDSGEGDSSDPSSPLIDTPELFDLGAVDSGSGETLKEFLLWGIENYPAQNYIIQLNDHGGGWTGLISDDTAGGSIITLPEYADAFRAATEAAGVERFALLINDACLMSSVEYLTMVAPYFDYALGASEIMLAPGYNLTMLTEGLRQGVSLDQLGMQMIDGYMEEMSQMGADGNQTPTMVDMQAFPAVTEAMEYFAQVYNNDPYQYAGILGDARSNTYNYSQGDWLEFLIDAGDFMTQVQYLSNDEDLSDAAQQALDAMQSAVFYKRSGVDVPESATHFNINFPLSADAYIGDYADQTTLFSWNELLSNYYNIFEGADIQDSEASRSDGARFAKSTLQPSLPRLAKLMLQPTLPPSEEVVPSSTTPQVTITSVYPQDEPLSVNTLAIVSMEVVGRNISRGTFTVDQQQPDGTLRRVDTSDILTFVEVAPGVFDYINQWDSGVNDFDFTWMPTLYTLSDGTNTNVELIVSNNGQNYLVGRYRDNADSAWTNARLIFNDEGVATRAVATGENGQSLAGAIRLRAGGEFQAYNAIVTPDGRLVNQPGSSYTVPEDGLTMGSVNAPSGAYNLGFLIEAHGGVTGFNSASVTVDNDSIDPALVGFTSLDEGFTIQSPADWVPMEYYSEREFYSSNDVDVVENYYVYPIPSATDLESTVQGFVDDFGATLDSDLTPITVSGYDAVEFTFTSPTDSGTSMGKGFAVYKSDANMGLVFSAEQTDGADAGVLYDQLVENTVLFDATDTNNARIGAWDWDLYTDETYYPVPLAWMPGKESDFGWRYSVPDVEGAFADIIVLDEGTDARTVLEDLVSTHVPSDAAVSKVETYYGENHTWEIAYYTASSVTGRIAVTIENDQAYGLWFEAPTESAAALFSNYFEPILDGFSITPIEPA
jgi:hypothetical protein